MAFAFEIGLIGGICKNPKNHSEWVFAPILFSYPVLIIRHEVRKLTRFGRGSSRLGVPHDVGLLFVELARFEQDRPYRSGAPYVTAGLSRGAGSLPGPTRVVAVGGSINLRMDWMRPVEVQTGFFESNFV